MATRQLSTSATAREKSPAADKLSPYTPDNPLSHRHRSIGRRTQRRLSGRRFRQLVPAAQSPRRRCPALCLAAKWSATTNSIPTAIGATCPNTAPMWMPNGVAADWAPYRYGHWVWISPWGWTWVDDASWGFAPFHYGRWVQCRRRVGLAARTGSSRGPPSLRARARRVGRSPEAEWRSALAPEWRGFRSARAKSSCRPMPSARAM